MINDDKTYFLNEMLGAYLRKVFSDVKSAMDWAEEKGINRATMRDVFYKNGNCGRKVFDQIVTQLFDITPEKAILLIEFVKNLQPIPPSQKIWNSIETPELAKRRLALVAKATLEIEASLQNKDEL